MATDPLTDDSRWTCDGYSEYLEYILTWPNPVFEPVLMPKCFQADPKSPEWLAELLRKTWEYWVGLWPIPVERRAQFGGGFSAPRAEHYGLDMSWVDLIHDHVGEEADD
jgi:hypothetical protein